MNATGTFNSKTFLANLTSQPGEQYGAAPQRQRQGLAPQNLIEQEAQGEITSK